jgi:hypothetical protein
MRLLVTRPLDEAERTTVRLRKLGHEALLAPMLRIEAIDDATWDDSGWRAVLMTSGNAARMLALHPKRAGLLSLPLFAVGGRTADAARAAGFADVISAEGDAGDLVRLVGARIPPRGAWPNRSKRPGSGISGLLRGRTRTRCSACLRADGRVAVMTRPQYRGWPDAHSVDSRRVPARGQGAARCGRGIAGGAAWRMTTIHRPRRRGPGPRPPSI